MDRMQRREGGERSMRRRERSFLPKRARLVPREKTRADALDVRGRQGEMQDFDR
jgi:hypothetical protein